jgi:predicted enzyme related to lactoylglutathione lyase
MMSVFRSEAAVELKLACTAESEPKGEVDPEMASVRLYRVILPVTDIDAATSFYAHILGEFGDRVSPGRHYFDCDGVILACYSPSADGDEPGDGWSFHENQHLYFAVEDLEAVRDKVKEAGGVLLSEIETMPWGETLFYAVDPFGSRICFVRSDTLFTGSS